jgi:predicted transglutaminase-like cysteine proteinase
LSGVVCIKVPVPVWSETVLTCFVAWIFNKWICNHQVDRATRFAVISAFAMLQFLGHGIVFGEAAQAMAPPLLPAGEVLPVSGNQAQPTLAWTKFCERLASECVVDFAEPATITLTRAAWDTVVAVNERVNATVRPLTDRDHWGVEDRWDYPADGFGDCEDYQLLKRKLLIAAGWPRRALRMTVVIDEEGAGHAVLIARTDRGDFVLDNKTNAVLPWNRTGYIFMKREGTEGSAWVSLGGRTSPVVTANP